MFRFLFAPLAAAVIAVALPGCGGNNNTVAGMHHGSKQMHGNVVEMLQGNDDYSTLVSFVVTADLADTLATGGPFTIFAPNNAAFAALPKETVDALKADKEALKNVLLYHVVSSEYSPSKLESVRSLRSLEGNMLSISKQGNKIMVDGAMIEGDAMHATNGIIYPISKVITPPKK